MMTATLQPELKFAVRTALTRYVFATAAIR